MTPRGYRHGLRVRMFSGERGVLLHCETRSGRRYWRVRLQGGAWCAPEGLAIEGRGDARHEACAECGLPFYNGDTTELICDRCEAELFGTAVRAREPDSPRDFEDIPGPRRGIDRHRRPWHS